MKFVKWFSLGLTLVLAFAKMALGQTAPQVVPPQTVEQLQFNISPQQTNAPVNLTGSVSVSPTGTSYSAGFSWGIGGAPQTDQARETLRLMCVQKLGLNQLDLNSQFGKACKKVNAPGL